MQQRHKEKAIIAHIYLLRTMQIDELSLASLKTTPLRKFQGKLISLWNYHSAKSADSAVGEWIMG